MALPARASALVLVVLVIGACGAPGPTDNDFVDLPGLGSTRIDVPRPTTATAVSCTLLIPANQTVAERAIALRALGLFADQAGVPDAEFGAAIEDSVGGWGDEPPLDFIVELMVAERDSSRVWWRDLEADVVEENQVYASTIAEWADISVGTFAPAAIEEDWPTTTTPTIAFDLNGERHLLEPEFFDDWIDPRIATPINGLIAQSGRRFEFFRAFDQSAFVMALTAVEREALGRRGWCFE